MCLQDSSQIYVFLLIPLCIGLYILYLLLAFFQFLFHLSYPAFIRCLFRHKLLVPVYYRRGMFTGPFPVIIHSLQCGDNVINRPALFQDPFDIQCLISCIHLLFQQYLMLLFQFTDPLSYFCITLEIVCFCFYSLTGGIYFQLAELQPGRIAAAITLVICFQKFYHFF